MSNATILAAVYGEGCNLYDILGTTSDATSAQLRKAYYRKALTCHPDKVGAGKSDEFQALSVAYQILSNEESRKEYDETGEVVDEEGDTESSTFDGMKNYFSQLFGKVTTNKIDEFAEKYKCSEEEESDVLKYYQKFKGNLTKMLENVMLSSERDAERWVEDFIQPAIDAGAIPDYSKMLQKTLKQVAKKKQKKEEEEVVNDDDDATESEESDAPPPKKRAKQKKKKQKTDDASALVAAIQRNKKSKGLDDLLGGLASKYGGAKGKKGGGGDPLDDDEFERIQAKMMSKRKR